MLLRRTPQRDGPANWKGAGNDRLPDGRVGGGKFIFQAEHLHFDASSHQFLMEPALGVKQAAGGAGNGVGDDEGFQNSKGEIGKAEN